MAKDTEVSMSDEEIDALMAELDAETGGTAAAPAAAAKPKPAAVTVPSPTEPGKTEEAVVVGDEEAEAEAAAELEAEAAPLAKPTPDLPRNPDPVSTETSNFILPKHLREPEPEQPQPATRAAAAAKAQLAAVPPAAAPEAEGEFGTPAPAVDKVKPRPVGGLRTFVTAAELATDTALSDTVLDNAVMTQASLFARYGTQAAEANAQLANAKLLFGAKEAECFARHRAGLLAAGEKATEAVVNAMVMRDPVYLTAKKRVIDAEQIADVCRTAVEAMRHKRDMIIQMGADRREDSKGQVRVLADQSLRERATDAARH